MHGIITFGDLCVIAAVFTAIGAVLGSYAALKLLKKA